METKIKNKRNKRKCVSVRLVCFYGKLIFSFCRGFVLKCVKRKYKNKRKEKIKNKKFEKCN